MCATVIALGGCEDRPTPPFALAFADGASDEEMETVLEAADHWNERLESELFYVPPPRDAADCDQIVVHFLDAMPSRHHGSIGLFKQVGCHYEVSILRAASRNRVNAAHELGHALDLHHSDDPESVMFWSARKSATIKDADVAQVRRRWGL